MSETNPKPNETEFKEIAHSGGQVIIRIATDENGRRSYQLTYQGCRPVRAVVCAVWAIPQGVPVGNISLGGIGQSWGPPPIAGCYPVFIGSDSEGRFGHECPACSGYWRSDHGPMLCPYCGERADWYLFLTTARKSYVRQYCTLLGTALEASTDGDHVIDMDAVADAVGNEGEKPPFYYAEQSQQNKFTCHACGEFNDVLGTFAYCSVCGTRNDLQEFFQNVAQLRARINAGGPYEACVRDAVATFDSFCGQYLRQLVRRIPVTPKRKARLDRLLFHSLKAAATELVEAFDIDLLEGLKPEQVDFVALMFHRRHVYEHRGGEADEKYIKESGDTAVRPKQTLRETQESAHQLLGIAGRMAESLHRGFHEIFPPEAAPIERHKKQTARAADAPG